MPGKTTPSLSHAAPIRASRICKFACMRSWASAFAASRVSVATWSLRERPVCRRLPASPMRRVSSPSIAMWMSSSSIWKGNDPASISPSISSRHPTMASQSPWEMMRCLASMRACAFEPAISCLYRCLSTGSDAPNSCVATATSSLNRPPQSAILIHPFRGNPSRPHPPRGKPSPTRSIPSRIPYGHQKFTARLVVWEPAVPSKTSKDVGADAPSCMCAAPFIAQVLIESPWISMKPFAAFWSNASSFS